MEQIVLRSSRILAVSLEDGVADLIGVSSRATPRVANRLVRAVRDFAQVEGEKQVSLARVRSTLEALGIDDRGLDRTDRAILAAIIEKFGGGPVGLSTLAAATAEEEETLEDVYEPYLLQQGYLQRTPKGRVATQLAYRLLGLSIPEAVQKNLFPLGS
jgi:Holliday junction DNA helicase RuvB